MAESHSFNVTLACEIGINAALMLQHFHFLQREKAANNKQDINGTYVRRSTLALTTTYPYWSEKVIKKIVSDLEEKGLLFSEVLNQNSYDRTKSYTLSAGALAFFEGKINSVLGHCIVPNGTMDSTKQSDDIVPNGPILNNYTDNYTNNYTDISNSAKAPFLGKEVFLNVDGEANGLDFRTYNQYLKYRDWDKTTVEEKPAIKITFNSTEEKTPANKIPDALKKPLTYTKEDFLNELEQKGVATWYDSFKNVWGEYIRHRKELRKPYKSAKSAAIGFKELLELSNYNVEAGTRLVERSIANGWQGLHPEKQKAKSEGKSKIQEQHEDLVSYVMNKRNLLNG
jgi:hypothetical protein